MGLLHGRLVLLGQLCHGLGGYGAGRHGVHADAAGRPLYGEVLGDPGRHELRRPVRRLLGLPRQPAYGREADYGATRFLLLQHRLYGVLARKKHPPPIDGHDVVPVLGRGVHYVVQGDDPGVRHEHVHPPEGLDRGPDYPLRVVDVRDVAHDGDDLGPLSGEPAFEILQTCLVHVVYDEFRPLPGEELGGPPAPALGGPRHARGLAAKPVQPCLRHVGLLSLRILGPFHARCTRAPLAPATSRASGGAATSVTRSSTPSRRATSKNDGGRNLLWSASSTTRWGARIIARLASTASRLDSLRTSPVRAWTPTKATSTCKAFRNVCV